MGSPAPLRSRSLSEDWFLEARIGPEHGQAPSCRVEPAPYFGSWSPRSILCLPLPRPSDARRAQLPLRPPQRQDSTGCVRCRPGATRRRTWEGNAARIAERPSRASAAVNPQPLNRDETTRYLGACPMSDAVDAFRHRLIGQAPGYCTFCMALLYASIASGYCASFISACWIRCWISFMRGASLSCSSLSASGSSSRNL